MTHLWLLVFARNETTVVMKVVERAALERVTVALDVIVSGEKLNGHFADLHKNS